MAQLISNMKDDLTTYKSRAFKSGKYSMGSNDSNELSENPTPSKIQIEFESPQDSNVNLDTNKPCSTFNTFYTQSTSAETNSSIASDNKNALMVVEAIMNPQSNHQPKITNLPTSPEDKLDMILQVFQAEGLIDPKDIGEDFNNLPPAEKFSKMRELMQAQLNVNQGVTGNNVDDEMQFMDHFLFKNDDLNKDLTQTEDKDQNSNLTPTITALSEALESTNASNVKTGLITQIIKHGAQKVEGLHPNAQNYLEEVITALNNEDDIEAGGRVARILTEFASALDKGEPLDEGAVKSIDRKTPIYVPGKNALGDIEDYNGVKPSKITPKRPDMSATHAMG